MGRETRWTLAVGLIGAFAVGYLVLYADRTQNWMGALTLVCVAFIAVVVLVKD
jgi:hypothetical protein